MAFGLDYSDARPSHAAMKTAGVKFVCRYIGSQVRGPGRNAKWLSPSEAKSLHADGFDVVVVFETAAQRADGGRAAGLADAHTAIAELAYCGLPVDMAVYFAIDFDATVGPKISAYFAAINEVLGLQRTGGYAGYRAIKALFDKKLIGKGWQTYAWSGGQWDTRNHLEQYSNDHSVGGASVDFDRSMKPDFGQWRAGADPTPAQEDTEMLSGNFNLAAGEQYPILFDHGKLSGVGFWCDNSFSGNGHVPAPAQKLRVAVLDTSGKTLQVEHVTVGRGLSETVTKPANVTFKSKAHANALSVTREDTGTEPIAFCVY